MALDMASKPHRADGPSIIAAAEREAGRLVWDADSQQYYLVHPALQTPFVITISSSPAWSRVEYTLEHPKLPKNLVKLTRDGAGSGYLEVETGVAASIDAFLHRRHCYLRRDAREHRRGKEKPHRALLRSTSRISSNHTPLAQLPVDSGAGKRQLASVR